MRIPDRDDERDTREPGGAEDDPEIAYGAAHEPEG
jgi:hypothetical protein